MCNLHTLYIKREPDASGSLGCSPKTSTAIPIYNRIFVQNTQGDYFTFTSYTSPSDGPDGWDGKNIVPPVPPNANSCHYPLSIPLYMHILVSVSLYTYIPYISTTYLHTRAFVISPYFPICIFTHCVSRITIFLPVLGFYICYDSLRYTSRYSIFILLPYICISTFHYISNSTLYNNTYYNICCCIYYCILYSLVRQYILHSSVVLYNCLCFRFIFPAYFHFILIRFLGYGHSHRGAIVLYSWVLSFFSLFIYSIHCFHI